jgi:hypothetical protein
MPTTLEFVMDAGHPSAHRIIGLPVTAITLDSSVQVHLGDQREFALRIERDFELADAAATTRVCFAPFDGDPPTGLDKLAGIVNATVQDSFAGRDGSLRVGLSNGLVLRVAPDQEYESWTLAGPGGVLVSLPGGGLG